MRTIYIWRPAYSLLATVLLYSVGLSTGLGAQCAPSISVNFNKTLSTYYSNGISRIAIEANAGTQTRAICSIEFYLRARFTNRLLEVAIYDAKGPQSGGKELAKGSVAMSTTTSIHKVFFSPSVVVPKNQKFWIVISDTSNFIWPVATWGTTVTHYRFFRNAWGKITKLRWNFRINSGKVTKGRFVTYGTGCPGAKTPILSSTGQPILGKSLTVDLSKARPSSPAILLLGASSKAWGRLPLPLDLKSLGAPGCFLLASPALLIATATDSSGNASMKIPLPNNTKLDGVILYTQFLVFDKSANAFGMVVSRGGKATIGSF